MKKSSVLLDTLRRHFKRPVATALAVFFPLWTVQVRGATFYWDADATPAGNSATTGAGLGYNGVGPFVWDSSTANWWDGTNDVAWPNAVSPYDTAIFTGVAGTVTLSSLINAGSLIFNTDGYKLTGGTLSLGGPASVYVDSFKRAQIDSIIAGTSGLTKTGNGILALSNSANSFSGDVSIKGGVLIVNDVRQLGTGSTAISVTGIAQSGNPGFSGGSLMLVGSNTASGLGLTLNRELSVSGRGPNPVNNTGGLVSIGYNTLAGGLTFGASGTAENRVWATHGTTTITGGVDLGVSGGGDVFQGNGNWTISSVVTGSENLSDRFIKSGQIFSTTLWLQNAGNTFTDALRIDNGTVRVATNSALGLNVGNGQVDLNNGTLEIRTDAASGFAGRTVRIRNNTTGTVFVDHDLSGGLGIGTSLQNQTVTMGALIRDGGANAANLTINGRNGYNISFSSFLPVVNDYRGETITNNSSGTVTFYGDVWNANNATASTFTVAGNGETVITGSVVTTAVANVLTKSGTGTFFYGGSAGTYQGATNISSGTLSFSNVGGLAGTSQINIGNATTTSGALTYTGGTDTLSKTILLNTTTANVYINSSGTGALTLTGSIQSTVNGAKTLVLGGTNTAANEIMSVIGDSTSATNLQKIGSGTWILSGANTFNTITTGATGITVSGGTLAVKDTFSGGSRNVIVNTAPIVFNVDTFTQAAGGTFEYRGAASSASTETVGALTLTAGAGTIRLTPGAGGTTALTFASLTAPAAGSGVNIAAASGTVTITGVATSTATTLPGNGHIYINGADFARSNGGAMVTPVYGTDAGFVVAGAALTAGNNNLASSNTSSGALTISSLKISGSQTVDQTGLLTINVGGNTSGGILQTGGSGTISGTGVTTGGSGDLVIRVDGATDQLTMAAPITATTTGGLTKNGDGLLLLQGAQAYLGGTTTINQGEIKLDTGSRLGGASASNNNNLTIRQDGTLDISGNSIGVGAFNGAGLVTNTGAAATLTIGNNNQVGVFSGLITGALGLIKTGTGTTMSLTGLNTYSGATTIGGGTLVVNNLANIGSSSAIGTGDGTSDATNAASLVFAGGSLQYTGANAQIYQTTQTPSISINRLFTLAGNGTIDSSGSFGAPTLTHGANSASLIFNNTADVAFSGATGGRLLTLTGDSIGDNEMRLHLIDNNTPSVGFNVLSFTKSGGSLWILNPSTSNTYTGITTISGGALRVASSAAAVQGLSASSPLVLNGGVLETSGTFTRTLGAPVAGDGSTVQISGGASGFSAATTDRLVVTIGGGALTWGSTNFNPSSLVLGSSTALGETEITNDINLQSTARTITVNNNGNTGGMVTAGILSGVISGSASLTKNGGGALILGDANTYTGNTVLNNGYLVITSFGNSSGTTASSLGASGGTFNFNSGTTTVGVSYVGTGETATRPWSITSGASTQRIDSSGSGALILGGTFTNTATGSIYLELRGSNTDLNTMSSNLTDNAANTFALHLLKNDGGVWVLTGNNTYTGGTRIDSGLLGFSSAAALGTATPSVLGGNNSTSSTTVTLASTAGLLPGMYISGNGLAWGDTISSITNGTQIVISSARTIPNNSAIYFGGLLSNNGGFFSTDSAELNISQSLTLNPNTSTTFTGSNSIKLSGAILGASGNPWTISNNLTGNAVLTISGTFNSLDTSAVRNLQIRGTGATVISGNITNSTAAAFATNLDIRMADSGSVTLSGGTATTYTGTTLLGQGTLILNKDPGVAQFGASSSFIFDGGYLQAGLALTGSDKINTQVTLGGDQATIIGTNSITFGAATALVNSGGNRFLRNELTGGAKLTISGTVNLSESATTGRTLTIRGAGDTTISGVVANGGTGAGGLTYSGLGTLTLTNVNTATGALTVNRNTIVLSGSGASGGAWNLGTVTLNPIGVLTLDNGAGNTTAGVTSNRLSDTLGFTGQGGTLNIIGASSGTNETVGPLTLNSVQTFITLTDNSSGVGNNLTFASVAFANSGSSLNLAGVPSLGTTNKVLFTTAPSGASFVFNGVIPRIYLDGTNFAKYDVTNGVVPLVAGDYNSGNNLNTAAVTDTMDLATSSSLTSFRTVNALKLDGTGVSVGGGTGTRLTITSGGILNTGGDNSLDAPSVAFTNTPVIQVKSGTTLTVNSTLIGGANFVKALSGTMVINTPSFLTGTHNLLNGLVQLNGGLNTFFPGQLLNINDGATLDLNGNAQLFGGVSDPGVLPEAGGLITSNLGAGLLVSSSGTNTTVATNINDGTSGTVAFAKAGSNTITLESVNTYSGNTTILGGTLQLQDDSTILNTLVININGATLLLNNNSSLQRAVYDRVGDTAQINLRAGTISYTGKVSDASTETFGAVTAWQGANVITATLGGTGTAGAVDSVDLTFASLTRYAGTTINFTGSSLGQQGNASRIVFTSPLTTNANGALGAWAIANSSDYAAYNSGTGIGIVGQGGYTGYSGTFASGEITEFTAVGNNVLTLSAGNTTTGMLHLAGIFSSNIAFSAPGNVLNLEMGGLLRQNNVFSSTIGDSVNPGMITAGGTESSGTRELVIYSNTGSNPTIGGATINVTSNVVILGSTAGLLPGMTVTNANFPAGTTIVSVDSPTQITLSQSSTNATQQTSQTFTTGSFINGATTTGSAVVTMNSTVGIVPGMTFTSSGTNVPAGTYVVSVDSPTQITLSQNAIATNTSLTFTLGIGNVIINSVIADNGFGNHVQLLKSGGGGLNLTANNTYTGGTIVDQGSLNLMGTGVVIPGGGLTINNATVTMFNINGQINASNDVTLIGSSTLTLAGGLGLNNTLNSITFNYNGGSGTPTVSIPTNSILTLTSSAPVTVTSNNAATIPVISGGTLALGASVNTFDIGDINIDGRTYTKIQPSLSISSIITGTGTITKSGAGLLQLSAQSTFTGLNVTGGGIVVAGNSTQSAGTVTSGPLGTGPVAMSSGTVLVAGASNTLANPFSFAGTPTFDATATSTWTLNITGALSGAGLTGPSITVNVINPSLTVGLLGSFPGSFSSITKTGAGTLIFNATNYTGNFNATALGNPNAISLINDGDSTGSKQTLAMGSVTFDPGIVPNITVNRGGSLPFPLAVNKILAPSSITNMGLGVTVTNSSGYGLASSDSFTVTAGANYSVSTATASNVIQGLYLNGVVTAPSGFNKTGAGTLVLGNTGNLIGAPINVTQGVLSVDSDAELGGAQVNLNPSTGTSTFRATDTFATSGVIQLTTASNTRAIEVTDGKTLTLNSAFDVSLAGGATLNKADLGTLLINASNTSWNGQINIVEGAILVNNPLLTSPLGTGVINASNAGVVGSELQLAGGVTISNPLTLQGTANVLNAGVNFQGVLDNVSGTNTYAGMITQGFDTTIGARAGSTLNITGGIVGAAHRLQFNAEGDINVMTNPLTTLLWGMDKFGAGTLTFSVPIVPATTSGGIQIHAGTMVLNGTGTTLATTGGNIVYNGATLTLDNSVTNTNSRLSGKALTLQGGALNFISKTSTETAGVLTNDQGSNVITISGTGTMALTFASLTSNAGSGLDLEGTFGASNTYLKFTTGPTLTGGILNRFTVNGNELATYSSSFGVVAFTGYSTATNILSTTATQTYKATASTLNSLTGNQTLNALTLNDTAAVGGLGGLNPATLTLTSGTILANGSGGAFLNTPIVALGAEGLIHVQSGQSLTVNSGLTGTAGMTKDLPGTLNLNAQQFVSGATYINEGKIVLTSTGITNPMLFNQALAVNYGGTLDLNGNNQFVAGLSSATAGGGNGIAGGTVTNSSVTQQSTFTINGNTNFAGIISGNLYLNKTGTGALNLQNAATFTGPTLITGGTLTLNDYGALSKTSQITINYGGLSLANGNLYNVNDRVNDSAPITMAGGTLSYAGRQQMNSSETLGAVTLTEGLNYISATVGGTNVNSAVLTLASLARPVGSTATLRFNGSSITLGAIGSTPNILITTAPTLTHNIIGPWAIVDREWASYDSTFGVGQLNQNGFVGYSGTSLIGGPGATDNVRFITTGTTILPGNTTVGTLDFASQTVATVLDLGGNTLTVQGGGILFAQATDNVDFSIQNGTITGPSGGGDLYLTHANFGGINRTVTFNAPIADNGGAIRVIFTSGQIEAAGVGNTNLNAVNTNTGGTIINSGNIVLGATGALGTGGLTINQAILTQTAGGVIPSSNVLTMGGGSLLNLANQANTLAGLTFNNLGGAAPTVNPTGTLTLTGGITVTTVNAGNAAVIGTGTLDLNGTNTFSMNVGAVVINSVDVAPWQAGLNINATIQNGGITKTGDGVLQLSSISSTFAGGVNVMAGGILIGASSSPSAYSGTPGVGTPVASGPLGTGTLTLANNTTVISSASNIVANALTILDSAGGETGTGNNVFNGIQNITFNGVTTLPSIWNATVTAPQMTVTIADASPSGITDVINKSGLGTLSVGNYAGTINAAGGLIFLADGNTLGTKEPLILGGAVNLTADTAITVNHSGAGINARNKVLQKASLTNNGSILAVNNLSGYGLEITGSTSLTGASHFSIANATASNVVAGLILSGVVSDTGGYSLVKSGLGTLALTNSSNTFGGVGETIDVLSGVLAANSDGALGNSNNSITLEGDGSNGTSFRAIGTFSTARNFLLNAPNNAFEVTQGSIFTITTPFTLSAAGNALYKNDNGVLEINADNTGWTGAITINGGTIEMDTATALGSGAITVVNTSGSALELNGGFTFSNALTIGSSGVNTTGALRSLSGANIYSGAITMTANSTIGADAGSLELSGGVSGAFALTLAGAGNTSITTVALPASVTNITKINNGTATLGVNSSSFVGTLTVNAGIFAVSGSGVKIGGTGLITVSPSGTLSVDDSVGATANRLGGRALTIGGGTFSYLGNSGTSTETLGVLTTNRPGDTIMVNTNGGSSTITFSNLTSNIVTLDGALNFVSVGAAFGSANNKLLITTSPTLTNSIIQRATVNGADFATWTSGNGIAAFTAYDVSNNINLGTTTATLNLTANANLTANRTINAIKINSATGVAVGATGAAFVAKGKTPAVLTLSAGGIIATGGGSDHQIAVPVLAMAGVQGFISVDTGTSLEITSVITGTAGWVKAGSGTLTLSPPISSIDNRTGNTITGNTTITGGKVILNGGNNTLVANQNLLVGPGATLDLNGNSQFVQILFTDSGAVEGAGGTITSTGVNAANGTLVTNQDNNARNWAGVLTGALSFARGGQNVLTMYSNNDYTGSTLISGGTITLKDGGRLSGTSAIEIVYSTLNIDNTGTKDLTDRVNDNAAINLRGGTLAFLGRAQTASTETVGDVSLLKGNSFINSTLGGTGINSADFTLTSLNRAVGGGTVNFTTTSGGQIGSSARILIPTINGISTDVTGSGLTNGIIGGWAVINTSDFATYIPGLGVAVMGTNGALQYSNTSSSVTTLNTALTTDNISINTAVTGSVIPVSNDLTINSLRMGNIATQTVDIAAGKTLTLSSGGLLFYSTASQKIGSVVNQGSLTTTGPELFIYAQGAGPQIINSVITGSGMTLVKSGAGTVTLNGTNTYDGGTTINQGTLIIGPASSIPLAADPTKGLILNGSTFTETAPAQIDPGNIVTINGSSILNLLGDNTLAGFIFRDDGGGVSGSQVVSNFGVLTINGNVVSTTENPSSTSAFLGRVDFGSTNRTLDISATYFNGQELAPLLGDFNLQGVVGSSGGITKVGNGVLQFAAPELYSGDTIVNEGRVQIGVLNGGSRYSTMILSSSSIVLNMNGFSTVLGGLSGSGSVTNSGSAQTLSVGFSGASTTFSGTFLRFNDAVPNSVNLAKIGTGILTFDSDGSASTTTGSLTVNRGAVTFKNLGTSSFSAAAVVINEGGTLNLDDSTVNSTANVANRLLGGALTLNGGTFNVLGVDGSATTDLAGVLTLGPSASNINLIAGTGGTVVETFASLNQVAGSTAIVSGVNLGTDTKLLFTTAPTLVPATTGILARIEVGTDFATYNSTNGIIAYTGYVTPTDINGAAGTATIKVDSTTTVRTLNLGRTINALDIIDDNVLLTSNGTLLPTQGWTITSGGILVNGNAATISAPVLALGAEGIFRVNGSSLNVTSSITGTAGITKTGSGSMTLSALESYTGQTALNLGSLILAGGDNTLLVTPGATIPGVADLQVNGGLLDLNGNNQAVRTLLDSNTLAFIAGEITNSSATPVTLTTAMTVNVSSTFGGKISGNLSLTRSGNGTLTLVDTQTYTGATIIRGGGLTLQDTGTLATSSIAVNYGTLIWNNNNLDPLANLNPVRIQAATPLTLQGGTFTVNGGGTFDTTVTINTLNITGGQNYVNVQPLVNQGSSAIITFGNLVRSPTDTSVITFNGYMNATGAAPAASTLGGVGHSQNGNIILNQINGVAGPVSYVLAATTTANSATVTVPSTAGLVAGMAVNGANIPVGATIANIVNGTTFTLNSGTGVIAGTSVATNINSGLTNNLIGGWAVADGSTFATYLTGAGVSVMGQSTQGNIAPGFDGTNISVTTLATQNINDANTNRTITGVHVANSFRSSGSAATTFTLSSASSLSLGVGWLTNGNVAYSIAGTDNTSTLTSPNSALYIYINQNTTSINANITGGTALVKAGGAALTLNNSVAVGNNTYTGGTFVQAGTLNLTAAAANIVVIPAGGLTINNATVTMNTNSGQIDSSNDVTINGGGVLTTIGTNTLNSVTFNNAGGSATPTLNTGTKLILTSATPITVTNDSYSYTPLVSGTEVTLADGATISTTGLSPDGLVISAKISTAGSTLPISKTGSGSLVLSSTTSAFTNGFNLDQGSLIFAAASTGTPPAVTAGPIGTGTLRLANGVAILSDGTARIIGNAVSVVANFIFGTADDASSRANAGNNLTLSGTVTLAPGAHTITVGGLLMMGTISGQLTGGTDLTKDGLGTLVLSKNTNNYGGATTVSAGVLQLGAAGVIPDGSALTVSLGGFFNLNGNNETIGSLAGDGVVTNSGAAATLTMGGDGTSTAFSGIISNQASALNLIKVGAGTQTLSGSNSYSGTTTVSAGILSIANDTALGTTVGTTVASGASLELQGGITVGAEPLSIAGTGASNTGALRNLSGSNLYGGTVTLTGDTVIQSDAGLLTLNAANAVTGATFKLTVTGSGNTLISGTITTTTGTLSKSGTGTLTLSGANTYTGDTTVSAGVLNLNTSGANALAGNLVVAGGTASLLQSDQIADSKKVSVSSGEFALGTSNETVAGVQMTGGSITSTTGVLTSTTNYDMQTGSVSAVLGGSVGLDKTTAGTVILSGTNTYTGKTSVTGGILSISSDANLGAVPVAAVPDQLKLDGGTLQATADVVIAGHRGVTIAASGGTFDTAINTTSTISSVITGGGDIIKTGAGALLFTAANTNTGAINVNAGTLGGTGTAGGDVNVNNGGTVAPGLTSDVGTLTIDGNLTVSSGGTLLMQLGGATVNDADSVRGNETSLTSLSPSIIAAWETASTSLHDHIVSNGTSAPVIDGTIKIDSTFLNGYTPVFGDVFNLLDWSSVNSVTGGTTFDYSGIILGGDLVFNSQLFASNGILVVVPEPGRACLLVCGLLGLLMRRRRRHTVVV